MLVKLATSNYAWDQLLVFNFLGVGKMSNASSTFVLKFIMLVAESIPFFSSHWLCVSVDFIIISKWSTLANFASILTFKWWHTIVSMDFRFP
jgi:hypothetical protein